MQQVNKPLESFQGHFAKIRRFGHLPHWSIADFRCSEENVKEYAGKKIVVVGDIPSTYTETDSIQVEGHWENSPKFGDQLKLTGVSMIKPTSLTGLVNFMVENIDHVGAVRAAALKKAFGDDLKDVLTNHPERLTEVKGISAEISTSIHNKWMEYEAVWSSSLFFASLGINQSAGIKIREALGTDYEAKITSNPYCLTDVHSFGFQRADDVARKLGFDLISPFRIRALLAYILQNASNEGHTCLPRGEVVIRAVNECKKTQLEANQQAVTNDMIENELAHEIQGEEDRRPSLIEDFQERQGVAISVIYLRKFYEAETNVARHIQRLQAYGTDRKFTAAQLDLEINRAEEGCKITLTPDQRSAVRMALTNSVSILTGGPGVGKTATLQVLLKVCQGLQLGVTLTAPTGRAAKRMSEVTLQAAFTIHKTLEFDGQIGTFRRDSNNQLPCQVLVADEVSMLDIELAESLLEAIPNGACVLFVGDPDQLPSVQAGKVLDDMLSCDAIPSTRLTQIFRQAANSLIVQNAHRINRGEMPQFPVDPKESKDGAPTYDMYFIEAKTIRNEEKKLVVDSDWLLHMVGSMVSEILPKRLGVNAIQDIQVLVPVKKGPCGVFAFNTYLQSVLNPRESGERVNLRGGSFGLGDRVMVLKNNREADISNGDIGFVSRLDPEDKNIVLNIYNREVVLTFEKAAEDLILAYASTVHKSQGSEYPVVVSVLLREHYMMLKRNLFYTGSTRAKRLLIVAGQKQALHTACKTKGTDDRYSLLGQRLRAILDQKAVAA